MGHFALNFELVEVDMSAVAWESEKPADSKRRSLAQRLAYGPVLILAMSVGSSGALAVALLLSHIFEF